MPSYRDIQKKRHVRIAHSVFQSPADTMGGLYKGKARDFCLPDENSSDNLHESIRDAALEYFAKRSIPWHDGFPLPLNGVTHKNGRPSNHTCCSQSQCVNTLFPFRSRPDALASFLKKLDYPVEEVLPILDDHDDSSGFVGFEWIGAHNYLGEVRGRGDEPAPCHSRTRGANFTSTDFIVRFRDATGCKHVVLGEWKYTEEYRGRKDLAEGSQGETRLKIYPKLFGKAGIRLPGDIQPRDLFFEPFYQMLRQQLLAWAMEQPRAPYGKGEMDSDTVSVLHVSPALNTELRSVVTSKALESLGSDIYTAWEQLAPRSKFRHFDSEDLIPAAMSEIGDDMGEWAAWLLGRYVE